MSLSKIEDSIQQAKKIRKKACSVLQSLDTIKTTHQLISRSYKIKVILENKPDFLIIKESEENILNKIKNFI
jgi:hypothetical protein